jgi:serine/threonine-protein kinase
MHFSSDDFMNRANARLGTVLRGKYKLDRVLGAGGMAVVYAATHRNKMRVAVKMLRPELSFAENIRTRFLREGYAANSVQHDGVLKVLDDDVAEDGAAFLVMELLEGAGAETLWERHNLRVPLRAVLALGHELCDVLAAAHAKGIVHRDIKPANLFITKKGELKVLDFGIARVRDAATSGSSGGGADVTSTGVLLGTPGFMAPEQALAQAGQVDGQTDVWAVGATMFKLLSGRLVHEGGNVPQIMIQAATQQAPSLASVMATITQEPVARVSGVIDRALAFAKTDRWASAGDMRNAIAQVYLAMFAEPVSTAPLRALVGGTEHIRAATITSPPTIPGEVSPSMSGARADSAAPRMPSQPSQPIAGSALYGTPPYGWRLTHDRSRLVKHPEEQRVLGTIRRLCAEGLSLQAVAVELATRGVRSRGGKPFKCAGVYWLVLAAQGAPARGEGVASP